MKPSIEEVDIWLKQLAQNLGENELSLANNYSSLSDDVNVALLIIEIFNNLQEDDVGTTHYSACIFAFEMFLVQLETRLVNNKKAVQKDLDLIMSDLAYEINQHNHGFHFWMPMLNAFYEAKIELSDELKDAYYDLASQIEEEYDHASNLEAIKELLYDLQDLTAFEVAEYIFAQTYAMPEDFFADLLIDLYSIDIGKEPALLLLMHPKPAVREVILAEFDNIIHTTELTSIDLYRLAQIKHFYPQKYNHKFDSWIKIQRKKGVVFPKIEPKKSKILASEIDGLGAQGIFIEFKIQKNYQICGVLLKHDYGIKEAWITPLLSAHDLVRYYNETASENIVLRKVDVDYLQLFFNHFLALTLKLGNFPGLYMLEIQELTGITVCPQIIDADEVIDRLAIDISPFTTESLRESLKRTKNWSKVKEFTESWYVENPTIDKLVNLSCSYVDGVKVCNFDDAMNKVFDEYFEKNREYWKFHFLWTSLWLKVAARKTEKTWMDCFCLAYAIKEKVALKSLPIMQDICYQSIINSVETMQHRKTYLN